MDTDTRTRSRIVTLCSLAGRVPPAPAGGNRLVDRFDFGRFMPHLLGSDLVMPTVAFAERVDAAELGVSPRATDHAAPLTVTLVVLTTPREDATLLIDCDFPADVTRDQVVEWTATTCFERQEMTWSGEPLLDRIAARMGRDAPLAFGLNVHHLVFAGGGLRERLLTGAVAASAGDDPPALAVASPIVYRGRMQPSAPVRLGLRMPSTMTSPGNTFLAHGRGVSVHAGWSEHVENALMLVAATLLSALSVLQRTRLEAFVMLDGNQRAVLNSPAEARELISTLADGVNEIQLDLAFGVEAYIDSLLFPEMVVEGFRGSLGETFGIPASLEHSSQMVERLTSVIGARSAALDAALAERDERRERSFSALIAMVTLIALPPALLLAYFGVNASDVDPDRSILDLRHYGVAYLVAWTPFLLLVLVGYWLRKKGIRMTGTTGTTGSTGTGGTTGTR